MKKFLAGIMMTIMVMCIVAIIITQNKISTSNIVDKITATPTSAKIETNISSLVLEINQLNRLETASLEISQEYTATRDNERLWGILGEELTFVAKGEVIAGLDLSLIDENSFRLINNKIIEITMPKARIFCIIIDNNSSYVSDRTKGIFAKFDTQIESEIRAYAQNDFEKIALNSTLLYKALNNGMDYIQDLIQEFGYTTVIFKIDS